MNFPPLFVPGASFAAGDVAKFYGNFALELECAGLSAAEKAKLLDRKMLGRLFSDREFFLHRFVPCLTAAARACFAGRPRPRALELGCGSGSLCLLLALLGAQVVGIDRDEELISACRKRAALYRSQGCELNLTFLCADAVRFDYAQVAPVDAVYSVYAFNLMAAPPRLLASVAAALAPGGEIRIVDGNRRSLYNRCFRRRRVLSPAELASELGSCGLRCEQPAFAGMLPPLIAASARLLMIGQALERAAAACGLLPYLATSYTLAARKRENNERLFPS